jgi:hypothetical protein
MADDLEAKKTRVADALRQARQTEEQKLLAWLPVVAKTLLAGAMAERDRWLERFRRGGRKTAERDERWARKYQERRPKSGLSKTALMKSIIREDGVTLSNGKTRSEEDGASASLSKSAMFVAFKRGEGLLKNRPTDAE